MSSLPDLPPLGTDPLPASLYSVWALALALGWLFLHLAPSVILSEEEEDLADGK